MGKRILTIENNQNHLTDAKKLLNQRVSSGAIEGVDYASTLYHANEYLEGKQYDGILSDLFFPNNENLRDKLNGLKIGEIAFDRKIPLVFITSNHHHGTETQSACDWARARKFELIDRDWENYPQEKPRDRKKNWAGAYIMLAYIMEGVDTRKITMTDKGYSGLESHTFRDQGGMSTPHFLVINLEHGNGDILEKVREATGKDPVLKSAIEKYCSGMFQ